MDDEEETEVCTTEALMNENRFCNTSAMDCSGICRQCGGENGLGWRCDNGECIPAEKRKDGFPDCKDGSDERRCKSKKVNQIMLQLTAQSTFVLFLQSI